MPAIVAHVEALQMNNAVVHNDMFAMIMEPVVVKETHTALRLHVKITTQTLTITTITTLGAGRMSLC